MPTRAIVWRECNLTWEESLLPEKKGRGYRKQMESRYLDTCWTLVRCLELSEENCSGVKLVQEIEMAGLAAHRKRVQDCSHGVLT
jgi:hypothetical protein